MLQNINQTCLNKKKSTTNVKPVAIHKTIKYDSNLEFDYFVADSVGVSKLNNYHMFKFSAVNNKILLKHFRQQNNHTHTCQIWNKSILRVKRHETRHF